MRLDCTDNFIYIPVHYCVKDLLMIISTFVQDKLLTFDIPTTNTGKTCRLEDRSRVIRLFVVT